MMCADMVEARWRDAAGKTRRVTALLEDISSAGACLQFERPVPLGVKIRWRSPKREFTGFVRYCIYREFGYFAGVEFEPASKWSAKVYRPKHLLDPQKLVVEKKK